MPTKEKEIENAFLEWQKENSIILSPRQAEAVKNLKYRISIVTGGPGTGKTTCLRAIMDVYHKVWPSEHILLMDDGITVPGKIIVAAQAAIDGGDFFL